MNKPRQYHRWRRCRRHRRRGSSLYITVVGTAMIVSLLGLAGMSMVRIEHRRATAVSERLAARSHARSAVELALQIIADDPDWRTNYTSGVETAQQQIDATSKGTLSWTVTDSDGVLTNADSELRLTGIGRVGDAVQVSTIGITAAIGPQPLRSTSSLLGLGVSYHDVEDDQLWCQYLKPNNLPGDATWWWVTSVELYCRERDEDGHFEIQLLEPSESNMPSTNVLDEVWRESQTVGESRNWHTFVLSGAHKLAAGEGICLAVVTTDSSPPIEIAYYSSLLLSEADSALIRGSGSSGVFVWDSNSSDAKATLLYRLHGYYQTASGEVGPIADTWQPAAAP